MAQSMTQLSNISIPARFIFRPFCAQWERTWAFTVGWGKARSPTLMTLGVLEDEEKITPRSRSVLIRIAIPRDRDKPGNASGIMMGLYVTSEHDHYEVEVERSDIPPDCLQPYENPETTPEIEGRELHLLICRLPDAIGLSASGQHDEFVRDAWAMREEFFALGDTINDTLLFLNRWGLWDYQRLHKADTLWALPFVIASPNRLWWVRDRYIKAVAGSPRAWLTTATPLSLKETDKRPYFLVERHYCEDAIKATITIDHLSNVKFGICRRHDCRRIFRRTTAQKRLYCTPGCAHLANVRKLRAAKKKAAKESK